MANDVTLDRYVESSHGPVYYKIMNDKEMRDELRRIATRIGRRAKKPQYRISISVQPGQKRAHAYVTGYMTNATSWKERGHNKKWGKILIQELLASLDRESDENG